VGKSVVAMGFPAGSKGSSSSVRHLDGNGKRGALKVKRAPELGKPQQSAGPAKAKPRRRTMSSKPSVKTGGLWGGD